MNCESQQADFDWEMIDFEHSDLKRSLCSDSKLVKCHFSLFFCKMCRTYVGREERLNTCISIHSFILNFMKLVCFMFLS